MPEHISRDIQIRATIAIGLAASGGATWVAIQLISGMGPMTALGHLQEIRLIAMSAGLAGWVVATLFGRSFLHLCAGAVTATGLGAALAASVLGMFELGGLEGAVLGVLIGPSSVFGMISQSVTVATTWVVAMLAVHTLAERLRAESCGCP